MVELAGYTHRVHSMVHVFEDCSVGRYERQVVKSVKGQKAKDRGFQLDFSFGRPVVKGTVTESNDGTIKLENASNISVTVKWKIPIFFSFR